MYPSFFAAQYRTRVECVQSKSSFYLLAFTRYQYITGTLFILFESFEVLDREPLNPVLRTLILICRASYRIDRTTTNKCNKSDYPVQDSQIKGMIQLLHLEA